MRLDKKIDELFEQYDIFEESREFDIPFKYILHEGHPHTSIEENINNLLKHNWLKKKSYKILFKSNEHPVQSMMQF